MKAGSWRVLMMSLALSVATAGSAFGQAGGGGGGGGPGGGGGFGRGGPGGNQNPYATMVQQLTTLTEDQKTQLKAKTDAYDTQLQTFQDNARQQMQDLLQNGGGFQDPNTQAQFQQTMAKVNGDRTKLTAKEEIELLAILTPDQKTQWEAYQASQTLTQRLNGLGLTEEEKTKMDGIIKDVAKDIGEAKDADQLIEARGALVKKIVLDVLTNSQVWTLVSGGGGGGFGGGFGRGGGGGGGGRRGGGGGGGGGGNGG